MFLDRALIEARLARAVRERIEPHASTARAVMVADAWDAGPDPVPLAAAEAAFRAGRHRPMTVGASWGAPWHTTWLRLRGTVPDAGGASGRRARPEAVVDLGFSDAQAGFQCEGLVWSDGRPLQGVHPRRRHVPLDAVQCGDAVELFVEAAANPTLPEFVPSPLGSPPPQSGDDPLYRFAGAWLVVPDPDVVTLLADLDVLSGLVAVTDVSDPRHDRILTTLDGALDAVDRAGVRGGGAARVRTLLAPLLAVPARSSAHRIVASGHAHIDTAWLWPERETVRKCTRTFASAIRLMADDASYTFTCSQAAQYAWMEERHPELFAAITERVREGRWSPVGGMWVEADMNLPGGEALVRQFVHGQRYFRSRFGVSCTEAFVPDVFGYPASMPQLFALAGCRRFVTQKLSWNKQNRFPHHTFWWEGLDGTRVLTHFPPNDTYNATLHPTELAYASANFREHGWSDWSLMLFGYGDGGGGPTREMLARAARQSDLDGVPRLTVGTVASFFDRVEAEIAAGSVPGPVPVWRGELYFEMHRGTYTSQVRTKVGNRACERALYEAELWGASAAALDALWKDVLVEQFHDIVPGSSIDWVHRDAERTHERVLEAVGAITARLLAGEQTVVVNPSVHARDEVIEVDGIGPQRVRVPGAATLPVGEALSGAVPEPGPVEVSDGPAGDGARVVDNGLVRIVVDADGVLSSFVDRRVGRELLRPEHRGVVCTLAPDHPNVYDAWDVESWTARLAEPVVAVTGGVIVQSDPLLARLVVHRPLGERSSLTTAYVVRAGSARVDVELDVDWHEDERVLSLVVPVDVRADQAACGIQFGHVLRPMHASTSWDAAKFEVCAHGWVDVSEPGFGLAVLNDVRYGHRLQDGVVAVTVLRAPRYPDPSCDRGRHRTRIGLLPHAGSGSGSGSGSGRALVLAESDRFERPVRVVEAARAVGPVVRVVGEGVVVSAVKAADDGTGDLVVRLYEGCGDRRVARVAVPGAGSAVRVGIDEDVEPGSAVLDIEDGEVVVALRPFEIVTVRMRLGGGRLGRDER